MNGDGSCCRPDWPNYVKALKSRWRSNQIRVWRELIRITPLLSPELIFRFYNLPFLFLFGRENSLVRLLITTYMIYITGKVVV